MDPVIESFLAAMRGGEFAAAIVLADYLQDVDHHFAMAVRMHAMEMQTNHSFLAQFVALDKIEKLFRRHDNGHSTTQANGL
jgi:hypothetical protein